MFSFIKNWFSSNDLANNPFYKALFNNDVNEMKKYINSYAEKAFPSSDIIENENNPENIYHVFILGLVADLKSHFEITSNEEKEEGFYFVQIQSLNRNKYPDSYIFEFMIKDEDDDDLIDTAERALMQITSNNYEKKLTKKGFAPENIKEYGFGFCGNKCEIMFQTAKKPQYPELSPPRFEKVKNHVFIEKEQVFILDKNEFDIWEGIIEVINGVKYSIHYPDYPDDDESVEKDRILPKTHKNKAIFLSQEEKRLKYQEIARIKLEEKKSSEKKKSPRKKRKRFS